MKEFPLSTKKDRITSVVFTVIMLACFGLLLYVLRNNMTLMIICGLAMLLLSVMMVFSVVGVLKSKLIFNTETRELHVVGFPSYTKDLSKAVLLQTMARKNGHAMTRILVFSDAEETVLAMIPTMYTSRQGILAEPMAKEMAQQMGIEFKANVPEWEYDKAKYEEHLKEEAEKEKAARKERQEMRKKKLLYRYRKK